MILVQRTDAVAAYEDDGGNDVPAVEEVPGLAGIPALYLSVMALHLMALIDDSRNTWCSAVRRSTVRRARKGRGGKESRYRS